MDIISKINKIKRTRTKYYIMWLHKIFNNLTIEQDSIYTFYKYQNIILFEYDGIDKILCCDYDNYWSDLERLTIKENVSIFNLTRDFFKDYFKININKIVNNYQLY